MFKSYTLLRYIQTEFFGYLMFLTKETGIHHAPTKECIEKIISDGGYVKFCKFNNCWGAHYPVLGYINDRGDMRPFPWQKITCGYSGVEEHKIEINKEIAAGLRCLNVILLNMWMNNKIKNRGENL